MMIFWIVGLLDEHRAWRSVCVACCGLVVWKVVICVCDAMSGDGFDEAMDLLDRWIRGWRQRGRRWMRSLQDGVFWMSGSRERRYFARKSCVATVLSFCEYFARSFANIKKTRNHGERDNRTRSRPSYASC